MKEIVREIILTLVPRKTLSNILNKRRARLHNKIKKKYSGAEYQGTEVKCSICQKEYKEFAPFAPMGKAQRNNAFCPNCGSIERQRLIWKYLEEKTNFFNTSKKRLLHFAPEEVFYHRFSHLNELDYRPVDLFPELYNYKDGVEVAKADITKIPHEDNSIDVIMCNHVLEHIPDDNLAMQELFRVLKSGGWGIFQVPIDENLERTYEDPSIIRPSDRVKHFGQYDHVRQYGKDYKERLEAVGFEVLRDDYVMKLSDSDVRKYGFMKSEYIYLCKKLN